MTLSATEYFQQIITAQKNGRAMGIMSVCSANRFVLETAMRQANADDTILCIESTANQVNQFGGYTGMTPKDFADFIEDIAREMGFQEERILLGGDHIGPGPWQTMPAETAMDHARDLVRDCVKAGYRKIHLDASMACIDDEVDTGAYLPTRIAAGRSADLCAVAEKTTADNPHLRKDLIYVIGTDVPIPGGMRGEAPPPWASKVSDVEQTISETKRNFDTLGINGAWDRTVAVVVQPGVDFGTDTIMAYNRSRAEKLVSHIKSNGRLVYEAHATDYQTQSALTEMVEDHFAILKVGPSLTFALREALTALAIIEEELSAGRPSATPSNLRRVMETTMEADPTPWIAYHRGHHAHYARYYSFSDRVRYYWPRPEIKKSIGRLLENLNSQKIPMPLISQYLPKQYDAIRDGQLLPAPEELIYSKIMEIISRYSAACRSHELR